MIVPSRPLPNVSLLFSNEKNKRASIFKKFYFYSKGRFALLDGLIKSGLKSGDYVVVSAYYCESTLGPLRSYGFKFVFIDIDEFLQLTVEQVKKIIKEAHIRALILTHYFGFEQLERNEIYEYCKSIDILMVDDYSHSFLSYLNRSPNLVEYDMCIFSIAKNLPVPYIGVLMLRENESIQEAVNHERSRLDEFKYQVLRFVERVVINVGWPNIYSSFVTKMKLLASKKDKKKIEQNNFDTDRLRQSMISYSFGYCLSNYDMLEEISNKRVKNYKCLSELIDNKNVKVFIQALNVGDIPQVLPVYEASGKMLEHLRKKGIGAYHWPGEELPLEVKNNPGVYSVANKINNTIICLPIHQDIDENHIQYMASCISHWSP